MVNAAALLRPRKLSILISVPDSFDAFAGWRALVCDTTNILHLLTYSNVEEAISRKANVLPNKTLIPGGSVIALQYVHNSAVLIALPSRLCHISLA